MSDKPTENPIENNKIPDDYEIDLPRLPMTRRSKLIIGVVTLTLIALLGWLGNQYQKTQALLSISATSAISPENGEIVITYRKPVSLPQFRSGHTDVYDEDGKKVPSSFSARLDDSKTIETIRFSRPTPFNRHLVLRSRVAHSETGVAYKMGLTPIPKEIPFVTVYEQVSINDLLPTASKQHSPEELNNQIAITFNGNVGSTYRKRIKLSPREVPFITMSPLPSGYFQWSDDNTISFNFTSEKPLFETTYQFDISPDKLLNPDFQLWEGDTSIALTTSSNDVYVNDVSIDKEVEWNTAIKFEFSGNMVGVFDLNKDKANDVMPVLVTPNIEGTWRWLNARTLRFKPSQEGWPIRNNIAVEFLPAINKEVDRNWTNNRDLNRIEFFVKPRLQSISNINLRGKAVDPEASLVVQFSRDLIDKNQLGTSWSITQVQVPVAITPAIEGNFRWESARKLIIEPSQPWSELTEYKVAIHPDFNPDNRFEWSGTKEFSFTTAENVITPVAYQIPEEIPSGANFYASKSKFTLKKIIAPEESIWIEFNRPFGKHHDASSVSAGVNISPEIDGKFEWLSDTLLQFSPTNGWLPEADYEVTLGDSLLYFHEQHFAPDTSSFKFHVEKDTIKVSMVKSARPELAVTLNFSKRVNTLVKIGRQYSASEVESEFLPLNWQMKNDYLFEWISAKNLKLTPLPYWPAEIDIKLAFQGAMLPRPNSLWHEENPGQFVTSKNIVGISSSNPSGQTHRNSEIEVLFSREIRPANIAVGGLDTSNLVVIDPLIAGEWFWQSNAKLVFKTEEPLAPSTDYSLTVHPEKISSREFTWNKLDKEEAPVPYLSHFHSPYQRVKNSNSTFDFDEQDPLKQRFFIDIELSENTTFAEVEKRFTLWTNNIVDGKKVEVPLIYKITTEEPKDKVRSFRVVSDFIDRPNEDRRVYFQIERGVPALGGNATMAGNYQSDFLQEKPKFIVIRRLDWAREDGHYQAKIRLSAPVEPEKLKPFLILTETSNKELFEYNLSVDSSYRSDREFSYLIEGNFEPSTSYKFTIEQGLLAADGALTNETISTKKKTPSLQRKTEFALQGNILSKYDAQQIPVLTSNVNQFSLAVDEIYPSNVRNFLNGGLSNQGQLGTAGKEVYIEEFSTKKLHSGNIKDVELTTHINLSSFFDDNPKGLYRIRLYGETSPSFRWFLSSDIALIARKTDEHVYAWAMSLNDAKPMANVKIELVDYWNQTVATAFTDSTGFVKLANTNPANTHILLASQGNDFSFLDMRTQSENFNGFDVSGVESVEDASRMQAYLYSERGVYRPGDTIHLVGIVRDQNGALPNENSVNLTLKDPTSSERLNERYSIDSSGIVTLDYTIPLDAKTGKWASQLTWRGTNIGEMTFQVEEFIPNKIKVALSNKDIATVPGQSFTFEVQANNLFGPPASGRKVNGQISLRPAFFKPAGFGDYSFGHDDHRFQQINSDLIETRLDEEGHHIYEYQVPEGIDSPIGLNLHYSATVIDDSGRGVAEYAQVAVHLYDQYVGVRRLAKNAIEIGDRVIFDTVNVTAAGEPITQADQSFEYQVFRKRKVTHYRKNERGYYRYVTEKVDVPLFNLASSDNRFEYTPEYSGEHYLQVTDLNGDQVTRFYFNVVGNRDNVSVVEAPEAVLLKARQPKVLVGDNLVIDVQAPFAGQLLLIVERDDVMWTKAINMTENSIAVTLPITAAHVPNFYLSAIVVQPTKKGSRQQPVYATGILNVMVRDPLQTPSVQINAPTKVTPNGKLTVDVSVADAGQGDIYFTLAAVDEGILDLTKFQTPNMSNAFTRKQRLDVDHFSVYPWVMPYDKDILSSITPSGSAPSRALIKKKRENPDAAARVKSVALWSGLQKFDGNGKATVTFDVPDFDGSLRLMLVTFGDQRYNSAETTVTVRDDLVLKPSLPRFMANGDHFELPFNLFNSTEMAGDVSVTVEHSDHVELLGNAMQSVTLKAGGEANGRFSFNVKDRLGIAHFTLIAKGLNEQTIKKIDVPVRSSGNYVSLSDGSVVDSATPKTIQIPKRFKPGTETMGLRVAPAGLLEFTGSLQYLLRYPHGCLEQTTSKLFPLLYFEDFAKGADFHEFRTSTPRYFLREGIDKIERMQLENGYFSYWSGGEDVNQYAFLYAAHFLAEARNKGLEVNENVWNNLQYRLNDDVLNLFVNGNGYDGNYHLSHQVYALYVLALSGNPRVSEMNYLLENKRSKLKAHDRARLAAAFTLAGRKSQASELLKDILSVKEYDAPYRQTSGTFASNARDLAVLLDALLEVDPQSTAIPLVIDKLSSLRRSGRWGSTQDNAMALMALGKSIFKAARTQNGDVIVTLPNGEEVVNEEVVLSTIDLLSGEVSVRTTGDAEANYFWQADGVSNETTVEDEDEGIKIRRQFLNTKKEKVDLNNIHQGDLIIVELTMSADSKLLDNVAVVDLLPTGLEIENARLSTSADIPWLKSTVKLDHADIRDDRMNLYLSLRQKELVYYYTTRAVTVGHFAVPAVRAEAMYDESKYSLSGTGFMKVLPME